MRPQVEPVLVVQEELPVAGDSMPHEQKRHGRLEWSEARVVDRSPLMAFVVRPEQDSVFHIRRNCELLEDVVKDALGTISRQVAENNDDDVVDNVVAVSRSSVQQQSLVAAHELDDFRHVPVGDLLWSKPKCPTFQGHRHEGTDGPSAAEILVRLDHEGLDPVGDGVKRSSIALRELARPPDILQILEEEEISGLCWHATIS